MEGSLADRSSQSEASVPPVALPALALGERIDEKQQVGSATVFKQGGKLEQRGGLTHKCTRLAVRTLATDEDGIWLL